MDTISQASKNVSILLDRKLNTPPIPIKSVRKNKDDNTAIVDSGIYRAINPLNIVKVYEIWQVNLENNDQDLDEVFIIISANATLDGYKNAKWSNINYEGFYTNVNEAKNEISGYLR